jgi:hypothetical protein
MILLLLLLYLPIADYDGKEAVRVVEGSRGDDRDGTGGER